MVPCTRSPASIICMLLCTMGLVFEVEIHQKGTAKIEESYKSEITMEMTALKKYGYTANTA